MLNIIESLVILSIICMKIDFEYNCTSFIDMYYKTLLTSIIKHWIKTFREYFEYNYNSLQNNKAPYSWPRYASFYTSRHVNIRRMLYLFKYNNILQLTIFREIKPPDFFPSKSSISIRKQKKSKSVILIPI